MMIFDNFDDEAAATSFVAAIKSEFGLDGVVTPSRDDSIDPFPFELVGPVAYVDRPDDDLDDAIESRVRRRVVAFGGAFAGT